MPNNDKSKVIPLTLRDDSVINVEITPIGEQPVSSQKRMFDEATGVIKSVAEDIASTLKEIKQEIKPDKFSVSLG